MSAEIAPAAEFRDLDEAAVRAALADPNPGNAVAAEVARLVAAYGDGFAVHCRRIGRIPEKILLTAPRWPIEAVAMDLATDAIRAAIDEAAP